MTTDKKIVDACNLLAASLYALQGYNNKAGFKYYEATHPHEVLVWEMAVLAYDFIEGTPVQDALDGLEDEADNA